MTSGKAVYPFARSGNPSIVGLIAALWLLPAYITQATDNSPKSITWLFNDAPPFFITQGDNTGNGICDVTTRYLIEALPEFEHHKLTMPHTRLGKVMDSGEAACFPCMIHKPYSTNRAKYSNPTVVYPPHVLVMQDKTKRAMLQKFAQPLSLEALLKDGSFIFARHGGRRFSDTLQTIIDKHLDHKGELILRNAEKSTTSIFDMLKLGRADYAIEYPAITAFYNATQEHRLQTIAIKENREETVLGAVGCSANAPGDFADNTITEINRVLPQIVINPDYYQEVSRWFQGSDRVYRQWYQAVIDAN